MKLYKLAMSYIIKTEFSFLLINILFLSISSANAPFATWTKTELLLNNGLIERTIDLPSQGGKYFTSIYKPVTGEFHYFQPTNPDFEFIFDNISYSGESSWSLVAIKQISDALQGSGASVTLKSKDKKLELTLKYLLYPNSPAIRKNLVIKNLSKKEAGLESVDIEKFNITKYWGPTFSWIFSDYGRRRSIGPYEGNIQDALVILHHQNRKEGIVIGNEASGVMKRTAAFKEGLNISTGLTHKNNAFPFRKWIKPGEEFETPQVFTMLYNNTKDPDEILNTAVPDFVRKNMGIRLSTLTDKPTFVYNTWEPFNKKINEKLIMELAKAAAGAGMKEFVIDDGWQDNYGDWGIDKKKFPNGLKPVFDYIKSLGMKPGLWVSIGTASPDSKVYQQHPEWFVKNKEGKPYSLVIDDNDKYTACFGTGWNEYIKGVLTRLTMEYGLEYLKLDFSVVTSPYRYNNEESGCYAVGHPGHKDHRESLYTNYEPMWKLFDDLHQAKPGLFIDCTFETLGGLQAIDYALLKHAEGDWLSNYNEPDETTDLQVRNMAWWRSPAMAATALVIGNPKMDDKGWQMHIKSLAGALPIMLGDPRKLSTENLKIYRGYANWLQMMQSKHDVMSYRQDIKGLGEPREGMWDGFQRINTETQSGGIIGVFRHGAPEAKRVVTINYLAPAKTYEVKSMDGKVITSLPGLELKTKGFEVEVMGKYDGELFEVSVKD
jgi:alpha-galactosidase